VSTENAETVHGLSRNSVGLSGAVAQSAAFIGPAVGLTAGNIFIAGLSGIASPFEFVIGLVISMCIALTIGEYAKHISSAGSFYTYLRHAFGPKSGFVTGVMLFGAYICVLVFTFAFFGGFVNSYAMSHGVTIPWQIWTLALGAIVIGIGIAGISPSLKVTLTGLTFEVSVFTVLAIVILSKGGAHGLSFAPFNPANSATGFSGVMLGSVFTIFAFVGFESATTLGEEVRDASRNIPRAVILTTLVIGVFYVFVTYAEVIGFGINMHGLHQLQTNGSPFSYLGTKYISGWFGGLVELATISSLAALCIAQVIAGSRVIFALGRDGMAPRVLGRAGARGTPYVALLAVALVGIGASVVGGSLWGSINFASWASFLGTLFFIAAYALLLVGIYFYTRRNVAIDFSLLRHLVIPVVGLIGVGVVLYGNVHPLPPSPLRYLIYVAVLVLVLAVIFVFRLERSDPVRLQDAGRILASADVVPEPVPIPLHLETDIE